jgi:multidrug efflux pump subunit AcrA (membrane-fusion protein)
MSWVPGWDSIASAHWWENFYFWASIVALILLGVMEVVSHRYTERKDELATAEQSETQRQHDEEIARLHLQAAQTEERAANLERENLEIRAKVAGRRISKEQHDSIVAALSPQPRTFDIEVMHESEAGLFASDIVKTLTDAHWTVREPTFPMGTVWTGLLISLTDDPAAGELAAAFKRANITFEIANERHERVTIIVGGKPSPF